MNIYELSLPDKDIFDEVVKEKASGKYGGLSGIGPIVDEYFKNRGKEGNFAVTEDSSKEPLSTEEFLAVIDRLLLFTNKSLEAGREIEGDIYEAFQGMIGKGKLSERNYTKALNLLSYDNVLDFRTRSNQCWIITLNRETVNRCNEVRYKHENPYHYKLTKWIQDKKSKSPLFNAVIAIFVILVTVFLSWLIPKVLGIYWP